MPWPMPGAQTLWTKCSLFCNWLYSTKINELCLPTRLSWWCQDRMSFKWVFFCILFSLHICWSLFSVKSGNILQIAHPISHLLLSVPSQGGCTHHSDCLFSEACIEGLCSDPCHCGINAECYVSQHRPYCTCPASYTGDPNVACYRGRLKFTLLLLTALSIFTSQQKTFCPQWQFVFLFQWNVSTMLTAQMTEHVLHKSA